MSVQQRNLDALVRFPLHPLASETTTFTGAGGNIANLQALDGDVMILLDSGAAAASGTMTLTIEGSDTGSGGWAAIPASAYVGGASFTAVAQAVSTQVRILSKDDIPQYIRAVGTIASSGTTSYSVQGFGVAKYQ
jgi:hypothetical protein